MTDTEVPEEVSSVRLRRVRTVTDALAQRAARRAAAQAAIVLPLLIAIPWLDAHRSPLLDVGGPVRWAAALIMLLAGWTFARDIGKMARPLLFRHLANEASGPVDFLLRAIMLVVVVGLALNVAGVGLPPIAVTGTVSVVLLGLAAQQTLSNVFAGFVLLGVHPYHIGDSVKLQGGGLAGSVEGRVAAMGLYYTRLVVGADQIHVPNQSVLSSTITPLREPDTLDLRATLEPGTTPSDVQAALRRLTTPTRQTPRVDVEELDQDHVVVRITATPKRFEDEAKLADEVVEAISPITG